MAVQENTKILRLINDVNVDMSTLPGRLFCVSDTRLFFSDTGNIIFMRVGGLNAFYFK